jgi:hypothetical protein
VAPVPGHHSRAVGAAWALSVLSTLSAIVFAAAAVAGWALHLWPATPATLAAAAGIVAGGPLISALLLHGIRVTSPKPRVTSPKPRVTSPKPGAAGARPAGVTSPKPGAAGARLAGVTSPKPGAAGEGLAGETRLPAQQQRLPQPPQRPLTPEQAWGRALLEWRERPLRRS